MPGDGLPAPPARRCRRWRHGPQLPPLSGPGPTTLSPHRSESPARSAPEPRLRPRHPHAPPQALPTRAHFPPRPSPRRSGHDRLSSKTSAGRVPPRRPARSPAGRAVQRDRHTADPEPPGPGRAQVVNRTGVGHGRVPERLGRRQVYARAVRSGPGSRRVVAVRCAEPGCNSDGDEGGQGTGLPVHSDSRRPCRGHELSWVTRAVAGRYPVTASARSSPGSALACPGAGHRRPR